MDFQSVFPVFSSKHIQKPLNNFLPTYAASA
jgi:hypothetical protein